MGKHQFFAAYLEPAVVWPIAWAMAGTRIFMDELISKFGAHQKLRGFSQRTIDRRRSTIRLLLRRCPAADIADISVETIEMFLAGYESAQTRHSYRSDINQFFKFLVRRGHTTHNPCDLIDAPRIPKHAPTPVRNVDVHRTISAATGETRLMAMLAAYAGLRASEIARLRADHVDLATRTLVVRGGKGGKDESVPIADELAHELAGWPTTGAYFPGSNRHKVYDRIKSIYTMLEIDARPHDLRHSYGTTAALRSNGNMKLVQRLMRHDSMQSTERYVNYNPPGGDVVNGMYGPPPAA